MRPRSTDVLWAVALASLVVAGAAGRKAPKPQPCSGGRFLVEGEALVAGDATPDHEPIVIGGSQISLGSTCPPVRGKFKTTKGGATKVKDTWRACQGLKGRVTMTATLPPDCTTIAGTLTARKSRLKKPFTAKLSTCGDGIVDSGTGEECDPPQPGSCDQRCRVAVATATIGPAGGSITSADGLLTLAIPAGALASDTAITIRRLQPQELSQELVDAGADVTYSLAPDGLQFQSPATVSFRLGNALAPDGSVGGEFALLFTTSAGGNAPELLAEQRTMLDATANANTVSGKLGHFSNVSKTDVGTVRVVVQPNTTLPINTPFTVGFSFDASYLRRGIANPRAVGTLNHTNQTPPGDVVQYAGANVVTLGEVKVGDEHVAGPINGYSCGPVAGQGAYMGLFTLERIVLNLRSFPLSVTPLGVLDVPITCVNPSATTTSTTIATTTTTTTTTTSTTTATTASTTTSTATSTTATTTTTTTTTTSTTTTTTSTTTTTTMRPQAEGCCDCNPGCSSGPLVTADLCSRSGLDAICPGGQPGTFVRNAQCLPNNATGSCVPITTTTTTTSTTSTVPTTTTSSTTTTTVMGAPALSVGTAFGGLTVGTIVCLGRISGGCVGLPGICPDPHLHATTPAGITITGVPGGPFPDPQLTGVHCGYGLIVLGPDCSPATIAACP